MLTILRRRDAKTYSLTAHNAQIELNVFDVKTPWESEIDTSPSVTGTVADRRARSARWIRAASRSRCRAQPTVASAENSRNARPCSSVRPAATGTAAHTQQASGTPADRHGGAVPHLSRRMPLEHSNVPVEKDKPTRGAASPSNHTECNRECTTRFSIRRPTPKAFAAPAPREDCSSSHRMISAQRRQSTPERYAHRRRTFVTRRSRRSTGSAPRSRQDDALIVVCVDEAITPLRSVTPSKLAERFPAHQCSSP